MDTFNAFKGIEDDIQRAVQDALPRQAVVTRLENGGVWTRFSPVDASSPESWFPSVIANLDPGTVGWVFALRGGKGLFIPMGVTV